MMSGSPLRPICNTSECDGATKIVHRLALREGELDEGEEAYLEVLEGLLERYESEHFPINLDEASGEQGSGFGIAQRAAQGAEQGADSSAL